MQHDQPPISDEELIARLPKRRVGCFAQIVIGVLSLSVLTFVALFAWNRVAARRFNEGIAKLRDAGMPTSNEEVLESYQPLPGLNPGPLWVEASAALPSTGPTVKKLPFIGVEAKYPVPPGEPWDQLEPSKAYLEKHSAALAMIERAANAKNPPRYEISTTDDVGIRDGQQPLVVSHRHIARVMGMAAYVHAHEGNTEELTKAIKHGFRVGHSLSAEPRLLRQLVSVACMSMMAANLREFISVDFADEQLQELQETIREFTPERSLLLGWSTETASVIDQFRDVKNGIPNSDDGAFFVEQMLPLLEVAQKGGWRDIHEACQTTQATLAQLQAGGAGRFRYVRSINSLSSLLSLAEAHARSAAELSALDSLLAARRYQLKHGRLPSGFDELVPEFLPAIPVDPFSMEGAPLIMTATESGLKIYSIGVNRVDDGGDASIGTTSYLDIVAELK